MSIGFRFAEPTKVSLSLAVEGTGKIAAGESQVAKPMFSKIMRFLQHIQMASISSPRRRIGWLSGSEMYRRSTICQSLILLPSGKTINAETNNLVTEMRDRVQQLYLANLRDKLTRGYKN